MNPSLPGNWTELPQGFEIGGPAAMAGNAVIFGGRRETVPTLIWAAVHQGQVELHELPLPPPPDFQSWDECADELGDLTIEDVTIREDGNGDYQVAVLPIEESGLHCGLWITRSLRNLAWEHIPQPDGENDIGFAQALAIAGDEVFCQDQCGGGGTITWQYQRQDAETRSNSWVSRSMWKGTALELPDGQEIEANLTHSQDRKWLATQTSSEDGGGVGLWYRPTVDAPFSHVRSLAFAVPVTDMSFDDNRLLIGFDRQYKMPTPAMKLWFVDIKDQSPPTKRVYSWRQFTQGVIHSNTNPILTKRPSAWDPPESLEPVCALEIPAFIRDRDPAPPTVGRGEALQVIGRTNHYAMVRAGRFFGIYDTTDHSFE